MLGKKPISQPTFADRLSGIKSMFRKAYDNATALDMAMQEDINTKENAIKALQDKIVDVKATQDEAKEFIKNLEKFI